MKTILLVYHVMTPSVKLCGLEQFTFLAQQEGLIRFRAVQSAGVSPEMLGEADAVVFVRSDRFPDLRIARAAKKAGKYLIYVLDDDLLDVPSYVSSADYYHLSFVTENIRNMMSVCDCLMTPSPRLAEMYGTGFSDTVLLEEPAVRVCAHRPSGGPVRIGFAGSADRGGDVLSILQQPLAEIRRTFGSGVTLELFGPDRTVADALGCVCHPYVSSYGEYRETMEKLNWDIGLAPIPDTPFHACKHYNKFIEYGSCGIIPVCSDLEPYTRVVKSGRNGFLCGNTPEAWTQVLTELIRDPEMRERIAGNITGQIREEFSVSAAAHRLWEKLDPCIPQLPSRGPVPLTGYRLLGTADLALHLCRNPGSRLPAVILGKIGREVRSRLSKKSR